jgi:hypothetical protein
LADEKTKSLEMRVAELEDKLSKLHISEEEMKTYQKVASLLGTGGAGEAAAAAAPAQPATSIISCIIRTCIIRTCIIRTCIINCINECSCGPGGAGGIGGAGFGGLGM